MSISDVGTVAPAHMGASEPSATSSSQPEGQFEQLRPPSQELSMQDDSYARSFFRRAWNKVESILVPDRENSPPYYLDEPPLPLYDSDMDDDDDDDDDDDEYESATPYHLAEHYPLHLYHVQTLGGHRRRQSTASQELIRPTRRLTRRYESWSAAADAGQRDEQSPTKNMIAGWAMGEVGPWFD